MENQASLQPNVPLDGAYGAARTAAELQSEIAANQYVAERQQAARRENNRRRIRKQALESRIGVATVMFLAGWAIDRAVTAETDPRVREERRHVLRDTWQRYSGDLTGTPTRSSPALFW